MADAARLAALGAGALHSEASILRGFDTGAGGVVCRHCHARHSWLVPRPAWPGDRSKGQGQGQGQVQGVVRALAAQVGRKGGDRNAAVAMAARAAAVPRRAEDMKISVAFEEGEEPRTATASSEEAVSTASVASEGLPWQRGVPMNLAGGAVLTASVVMMAVIGFLMKPKEESQGSVSDLVKRGQLRSDRGADSRPLNYEDPFNNPLVKVADKNSTVKVDGRLFRVQPVMLTEEKLKSHQTRRTQAYKWKRPVVFLNEGDTVPAGVDPDEVRWIPSNHPFATTNNYIDEDAAQKNVYQTRGVPSRVRAEHEALRRKMMEATKRDGEMPLPNVSDVTKKWETSDEGENKS